MSNGQLTRRGFLQGSMALAAAGAGAGIAFNPREAFAGDPMADLSWQRAQCRFCGTGCSVMVGLRDGKIIAVRGDEKSPVNRGNLCVKGYALSHIHTGKDRLTVPLIRKKGGVYDKGGTLVPASWDEALDLMARKATEALEKIGPQAVSMFGSGQWLIWEGYAALKLWKAGLRSNSLEVNARHCMASAVAGFMTTFGMDEPMGSYDDLDQADVFVLWGANMAEMHPILFQRIVARLRSDPKARLINLTTVSNRSSDMGKEILFKPQTDLAIANGIARLIVERHLHDRAFMDKHVVFKKGKTGLGYGMEDKFKFKPSPKGSTFAEYTEFLGKYTPEYVQEISGVSPADLSELANLYGRPEVKLVSLWTMGMNQHTRGTWVNNLVNNLHLITGKISTPGSQPYSLTGQPSACGTCREVGTFTHRLPADMVVANPAHRKKAEELWGVAPGTIPAKPTYHAIEMMRAIDRGEVTFFWSQTSNPFQDYPNLTRFSAGARKEGRFIVVSDVYPTRSTDVADVVLPSAMWVEKEGAMGNSERRTQFWKKMIDPPGDARSDYWQTIEFAKRMGHGKLFEYSKDEYPIPEGHPASDAAQTAGVYIEKALWEEYRRFGLGSGHDLAPFDVYQQPECRGLRWPVREDSSAAGGWAETVIRYREGYDSFVPKGAGVRFYGNDKKTGGKANVWLRPYEPAAEVPDKDYPFWLCTGRVMEHWHTGTMTRRVPALYRAYPHATAALHPDDAAKLGVETGRRIRIASRRGSVEVYAEVGGRVTPQKGMVFVPFFDEDVMINDVTLDAFCPISKETDYKKCAVSIEKI